MNTFNVALNELHKILWIKDWKNDKLKDQKRNIDIYRGLDIAAGIQGPEGPDNARLYYEYLNGKLDQIVTDTGLLGVIV